MSVAIEHLPHPFLVTVSLGAKPSSLAPAPTPAPAPGVRSSDVEVPLGWAALTSSEVAELAWEDAAWQ